MTTVPLIMLLLIGYAVYMFDNNEKRFPIPVILLLIGIGLYFVPFFAKIEVTESLIYHVFLPGLLFASAYRFSVRALKKNARVIGLLSTIGLLVTAVLLGTGIYFLGSLWFEISFIEAMVVAAVLTPTDPVSVVAILRESTDDESIANIVEGESLINDGTSIVLFTVLAEMYISKNMFRPGEFTMEFLYVSIGGVLTGILAGWLLNRAVHITKDRDYRVMLSIIAAYGAFELAENLEVSGVLATVATGIMLSWHFERTPEEDKYEATLTGFWIVIEATFLILLFLLIGIVATEYLIHADWLVASAIFVLSIVVRFFVVFGTMQLFRGWRKIVDWRRAFLVSWSGIRGTMSVFLLLTLSVMVFGDTNKLLFLSFPVVCLSLVIQSIGIYPLSKWLDD